MKISSILFMIWGASLFLVGGTVTAVAQSEPTQRLLMTYDPALKVELLNVLIERGGVVRHDFSDINTLAVTMPTTFRRSGTKLSGVMKIVVDPPVYPMLAGEAQPFGSMPQQVPWGIELSGASTDVWKIADGSGVRVCIIDTGVDRTHEDIQYNNIVGGYSGVVGEAWFDDHAFHGTAVVGVINATNNDVGVVGVAPGRVELLVADIFSHLSSTTESDILGAAEWCQENGANIINMSLGTNSQLSGGLLSEGFQQIYNAGVLLIAAAGNQGTSSGTEDWEAYPASYSSVVSVGSTNIDLVHSEVSQENNDIELSAPGVSIATTSNEPELVRFDDQSLSANVILNADVVGMYTATFVDGGSCNDPVSAGTYTDLIVLCERGDESFWTKINNVAAGGGIAAIVYNGLMSLPQDVYGVYYPCCANIPSVLLSREDGLMLLSNVGQEVTIEIGGNNYVTTSGTSFAAPHVTGGAAILWSACPSLTNDQIRAHLAEFAHDLGDPGRDISYGYGFLTIDDALDGLFDDVDTYKQSNANGDSPANVECATDIPIRPLNTPVPFTSLSSIPPTNTPMNIAVNQVDVDHARWTAVLIVMLIVGGAAVTVCIAIRNR